MSWQENIRRAFSEREQEERRLLEKVRSAQERQSDLARQERLRKTTQEQELQRASDVLRWIRARSLLEQVKRDVWHGAGVIREREVREDSYYAEVSLEFSYRGSDGPYYRMDGGSGYTLGRKLIKVSISSSKRTSLSVDDTILFKRDGGSIFDIFNKAASQDYGWQVTPRSGTRFDRSITVVPNNYQETRRRLEEVVAECCRGRIIHRGLPHDLSGGSNTAKYLMSITNQSI